MRRVNRRLPCPVCSHKDWCSLSDDGSLAFCMRVERGSFKTAANGAHMHRLTEAAPPLKVTPKRLEVTPRAPADHIDAIYSMLLRGHLALSDAHRRALKTRGLSNAEIEQRGYRSTPDEAKSADVARALAKYDLRGVPGFYRDGREWRMVRCAPGFFIPYRDERSRIQGLQYRLDTSGDGAKYIWLSSNPEKYVDGTGSGAPLHFTKPRLIHDEVTITEGALKADVAAYFLRVPVIASAGVACFGRDFATRLKREFPRLHTIRIAFDMDWKEKEEVRGAVFRLMGDLETARFTVLLRAWPPQFKGIDDYLSHVSKSEGRRVA